MQLDVYRTITRLGNSRGIDLDRTAGARVAVDVYPVAHRPISADRTVRKPPHSTTLTAEITRLNLEDRIERVA